MKKSPEIIRVKGFWKINFIEFEYVAAIGSVDISIDDDIFYYFEDSKTVIGDHGDFMITSFQKIDICANQTSIFDFAA